MVFTKSDHYRKISTLHLIFAVVIHSLQNNTFIGTIVSHFGTYLCQLFMMRCYIEYLIWTIRKNPFDWLYHWSIVVLPMTLPANTCAVRLKTVVHNWGYENISFLWRLTFVFACECINEASVFFFIRHDMSMVNFGDQIMKWTISPICMAFDFFGCKK